MSIALLIDMVSIPILLRISTHRGHVLVVFLSACILYLSTHEMYFIWSHLFAESYDSNSDINAPFGKWSCKFKFHGVLQKYHKWSNTFTSSLKTLYKSWYTVLVQKWSPFTNFTCLRTVARRCIHYKLIWRHWSNKMPVRYILSNVWVILSKILSVIHHIIYGAECFQFTHFPRDDWENVYVVLLLSSNRKYKILSLVYG